ncbi:MAG: serine/threonine protein kinase [Deltaproteobacteria bacterium]|nr:serine/threonine protein kinase [Deltaproteobacteria bacterium]
MTESGAPEKRSSPPVGHGEGDVSPSASDIRSTERGSGVSPSPPLPRSSKPSVAEPLVEGTVLQGTYKVMGLLGRGAMGAVYLVEHIGLGKQFAAKVVDGDRALDASAVARLRNEARITSAIEHENIVNVTHFGQTDDGRVFIVMELLRGQDLRKRMTYQALEGTRVGADPWLPDSEVRAIVGPLLSALAAAHAEGVVHRDLKPDNIFLSESKSGKRRPKVVDFGIGKLHTDAKNDLRLTDTGSIIGTPLYMAPEQSRSSREVDHRADLYSMGVMIFEMMCARPPFEAAHVFEMVVKHATEEPPDPRSIRPDIPEPVAAVILRSLAKEPSERFASANEMLEAWQRAWGEEPAEQRDAATSTSSQDALPVVREPEPGAPVVDRVVQANESQDARPVVATAERDSLVRWAGAILGVVALAVVAVLVLRAPTTTPEGPTASASPARPSTKTKAPAITPQRVRDPAPPPARAPEPVLHTHRVTSDPPGAEVIRDGAVVGRTPLAITRRADETVELDVRLRGRRDAHVTLDARSPDVVPVRLARAAGNQNRRDDFPGLAPR